MIQKTLQQCLYQRYLPRDKGTIIDYLHVKNMEFDDVDNSEGDDEADTDRNKGYCRKQKGFLLRHFSKDGANKDGEHGDVNNCCNNWQHEVI